MRLTRLLLQSPAGLPIREDGRHNVFVANLSQRTVESYAEFERVFR